MSDSENETIAKQIKLQVIELAVNELKPDSKYIILVEPQWSAFIDDMYVQFESLGMTVTILSIPVDHFKIYSVPNGVKNAGVMTGQEWLNRYQQEMRGKAIPYNGGKDDVTTTLMICEDAARKAAGLGGSE